MKYFLAIFVSLISSQVYAADRPNILWIYLEDVSGWFSCYGETLIDTPNIDRLAARGIRFNRFYTPAGVCSATRSAVIVGAMQTSFGIHNHRSGRPDFRGKGMGADFDDIRLPDGVEPLPVLMKQAGYFTFNQSGKDDYNFRWTKDEFYSSNSSKNLWRNRRSDQPFFGQVQLRGGKLGRNAKPVVARSEVPVPPYYPDIPEVREEIAHHYDCILKTDQEIGDLLDALEKDGLTDSTLIVCFSDHGYKLHRHKQFLYEGGIHMPLIIAGPGVAPDQVRDDLVSGIDIAPASLAAAGLPIPSFMEGKDFLSKSYTPRKFVVAARDRCDYTIEKIRAIVTPRFKYLRNYLTDRPFMQPSYKDPWPVSIRFREMMAANEMNQTQLIFFGPSKQPEELYDLENDPHEINNLVNDPAFQEQLEHHREILRQWIKETGDKGQNPESDAGLLATLKRWGKKCVNPEYDRVRSKK
ncbi:MAG: sulfatase [Pirellulales bacterium]